MIGSSRSHHKKTEIELKQFETPLIDIDAKRFNRDGNFSR